MKQIVLGSWEEVAKEFFVISEDPKIRRHRSRYIFRGLSDKDYGLETSLIRLGGDYRKMEYHLMRNFKKYARMNNSQTGYSEWKWLSIAQHYELPTRLLDWTFSSFVALHFATSDLNQYSKDGAVWCLDFLKTHQLLPKEFREVIGKEKFTVFTVDTLDQVVKSLKCLEKFDKKCFVLFFEPPSLDERIVNQYALFSMMNRADGRLDRFLKSRDDVLIKYIIPGEVKWEIRNMLDQININERTLFPGLDGLARHLKRHYSPAPENRRFFRD